MIEKRKVVLVGTGFVGMSFAYTLLNNEGIDELVLVDVNQEKAEGEAMDLAHAIPFAQSSMNIKAGTYADCKDASVIVITAGAAQKPGQTRLELTAVNTKIMKDICQNIKASGFNGITLIASNPCDVMTYVAQKVLDVDTSKVFGSGTMLDTARLRHFVGEHFDVNPKDVQGFVLGEHGDSSVVPWTHTFVGCQSVLDMIKKRGEDFSVLDNIYTNVRDAAYEIINRKKATYYGIGMSLNKIVNTILNNGKDVIAVSAYQDGEYKNEGIYTGVPAVVGSEGVEKVISFELTDEEQAKFDKSCNELKKVINEIVDPILNED